MTSPPRASTTPSRRDVDRLLDGLPAAAGSTVIVRVLRSGSLSATVRDDRGGPPAVYVLRPGARGGEAVRERLDPARDPRLVGAWLLEDRRALAERLELPAGRIRAVDLVGYRPETRAVARLDLGPGRPCLYLKLLARRAYERAASVLGQIEPGRGRVRLALPERFLPAEWALVTERAEGRLLHELLRAGEAPPAGELDRAIRDLAGLRAPPDTPRRTAEDERRSALKMLERGARMAPDLADLQQSVREAALPGDGESALLHTDLHDKQVFVSARGLHVIDVEGASLGDPRLDRVNFVEHCRLRALQAPGASAARALGVELAARWGLDPDDRDVRALRALVRARIAGVYALRPAWAALSRRLAGEATDLLRRGS